MDSYEQHNEVSTSYNNNIKHNFNECKNDFYEYDVRQKLEKEYYEKNYRLKLDEQVNQANLNTPFSVKDILNINQAPYYERSDVWKPNERRNSEYETLYHQSQYCPEYFSQVYSNIPVHNDPYWNPDVYQEAKIEDYYGYNPYNHNLYQQNHEYSDLPPYNMNITVKLESNNDVMHQAPVGVKAMEKTIQHLGPEPTPYSEALQKFPTMIKKPPSKYIIILSYCISNK